ncbi:MAG: RNA polymerase sigma factor [Chthoniobacterales bacterium]
MPALALTMTALADQETFTSLLEQHAGIIRKVAFSYTNTFADRRDLEQEIALQLWKSYPRYAPERPFSTWMYRVALNVGISFLRRNTHPARQTVPLHELPGELADETAGAAEQDERIPLLQQVLATLAPLDRALVLLYLDEHSYRDIASILGLTETNVATKLSRLKDRVREQIEKLNHQKS